MIKQQKALKTRRRGASATWCALGARTGKATSILHNYEYKLFETCCGRVTWCALVARAMLLPAASRMSAGSCRAAAAGTGCWARRRARRAEGRRLSVVRARPAPCGTRSTTGPCGWRRRRLEGRVRGQGGCECKAQEETDGEDEEAGGQVGKDRVGRMRECKAEDETDGEGEEAGGQVGKDRVGRM